MQKTAPKSTKYSSNETIFKIRHLAEALVLAKAIAPAKWSVWDKNQKCQKHAKDQSTSTLNLFCAKKSAAKKNKYSSNEITLKIGHLPKAIAQVKARAFPKWSVWVKKLKMPKTCRKPFYQSIKVVLCKKNCSKRQQIFEK